MRVVFAGTPPFAARALEALLDAGHDIPLVLTQPDRPAGRGLRVAESAVSGVASKRGIALFKPATLRAADALEVLRGAGADVMVVAAYGLILPAEALAIPRRGCINIHASLLPRWRGAAPIQRAILAGDEETGISIMQMDAGLDTGAVLLARTLRIGGNDTTGTLTRALAELGAESITAALADLDALAPTAQDPALATYASKITKADTQVDWTRPAVEIHRQVRALNPTPGAITRFAGEPLKIWEAAVQATAGAPGQVLRADEDQLVVACGDGALALGKVQRPGGNSMPIGDFLRGNRVPAGARFEGFVA